MSENPTPEPRFFLVPDLTNRPNVMLAEQKGTSGSIPSPESADEGQTAQAVHSQIVKELSGCQQRGPADMQGSLGPGDPLPPPAYLLESLSIWSCLPLPRPLLVSVFLVIF